MLFGIKGYSFPWCISKFTIPNFASGDSFEVSGDYRICESLRFGGCNQAALFFKTASGGLHPSGTF